MSEAAMSEAQRFGGFRRRELIRIGGLTALGLGLGDYLRHQRIHAAERSTAAKAKSCILIWLDGGPYVSILFGPWSDRDKKPTRFHHCAPLRKVDHLRSIQN